MVADTLDPPPMPQRPGAARRLLGFVRVISVLLGFVLALVLAIVIHSNVPVLRQFAATVVTRALGDVFEGEVRITSFTRITPTSVVVSEFQILDPSSELVLKGTGLTAHANLLDVLFAVAFASERLDLVITHVRLEHSMLRLAFDAGGTRTTLERALTPKKKPPSARPSKKRPVEVFLPGVELGEVWASIAVDDERTIEARLSGAKGRLLITDRAVSINVERFSTKVSGLAKSDIAGTTTLSLELPASAKGEFHGFIGGVEFHATAEHRADLLRASIDLPPSEPAAIAALVPDWPLKVACSGHADLNGKWPNLKATLTLDANDASVDAEATLALEPDFSAQIHAFAQGLDLSTFDPSLPRSSITAEAELQLSRSGPSLRTLFQGRTEPTVISGQQLPAIAFDGSYDALGLQAEAKVFEPHAAADLKLSVRSNTEGGTDAELRAKFPSVNLEHWQRIPRLGRGNASITFDAKLVAGKLDAKGHADVRHFSNGALHIARATVDLRAKGALATPRAWSTSAEVRGSALTVRDTTFSEFALKAQGPWQTPSLELTLNGAEGARVHATGIAEFEPVFAIRRAVLDVTHKDLQLKAKARHFDPNTLYFDINDFELRGQTGTVSGYLRRGANLLESELSAERLDLGRLSLALGLPKGELTGRAGLKLELAVGRDVTRGKVTVALTRASFRGYGSTTLRANATLKDEQVAFDLSGIDPLVGRFAVSASGQLASSVFDVNAWRELTGTAEIRAEGITLAPLGLALMQKNKELEQLSGDAFVRVLLQRTEPRAVPNVFAEFGASKLAFAWGKPNKFSIADAELHTNLGADGQTGDLSGAVILRDRLGDWVTVSGRLVADWQALLDGEAGFAETFARLPLDLVATLKPRQLAELPEPFAMPDFQGNFGARAALRGSLAKPMLSANVAIEHLVSQAGEVTAVPVDLKLQADYSPVTGRFNAQGDLVTTGVQIAYLTTETQLPWSGLGELALGDLIGHTELTLNRVPLRLWGPLNDSEFDGALSGRIVLAERGEGFAVDAELTPSDVSVGRSLLGSGAFSIHGTNRELMGRLELDAATSKVTANVFLASSKDGAPQTVNVDLKADRLEAAVLAPVVGAVMSDLSGQLDTRVSMHLSRTPADLEKWETRINGNAELRNGSAHITALGLPLKDINVIAQARSIGQESSITITNLEAKARSAKHNLTGDANLRLRDLAVVAGDARLSLEDVPLMLQGVSNGWGTGLATLELQRKSSHMLVDVNINDFRARLPRNLGRELVDTDENPDFGIKEFETTVTDSKSLPWRLVFHLGKRVRLYQADINLMVRGSPSVELGEKVRLRGDIELTPGGRIPILGKPFLIEHGSIRLNPEDPENPLLNVRAAWRDSDGTNIYVAVNGAYKDLGEIELSSDSGASKEEIWRRIQGGDEESGGGVGEHSIGGGELLGEAFSDIAIRVEPGEKFGGGAAWRVSDKLWLEGKWQRDDAAPLTGGPSDVITGVLDYRFTPKWSLRTEMSNAGGAMDLLWQHRY